MPLLPSTVQSIVVQSFFDLGAVAAGETPSPTELADGLQYLNQMLGSWSTEGATVFNQVLQSFPLQAYVTAYTLGAGGSFSTTGGLRAQKVTAWRAVAGIMVKGGAPLSMEAFGAAAAAVQAQLAELTLRAALEGVVPAVGSPLSAPIPTVVGCDTSYPLINVRVAPAPAVGGGQLELAYWTPIAQFNALTDVINLPPGYEAALRTNLAIQLAPQYARASGVDPALAANAQNSKASIVQMNSMQQQQVAAPQQQAA